MLKVTVAQPNYYIGENPDEKNAEFLIDCMKNVSEGELLVLPEYSNAGGLSLAEDELNALPRASVMLENASRYAQINKAYIAVNVLEKRDGDIKNSTYLFDKSGEIVFVYDKIHLPPSEISLGVKRGNGKCICQADGLKIAFMTCYDVYFNEQIEYIASQKPDIIIVPGYQRGERVDIIRAQAKLAAFRCNAFILRSSFSMGSDEKGGCSMIVSPDGKILKDMGKDVGTVSSEIDPAYKFMRPAGFGGDTVRNDDFINAGLCPEIFS